MADRLLRAAAAKAGDEADDSALQAILKGMGAERRHKPPAPTAWKPKQFQVGERVWDPSCRFSLDADRLIARVPSRKVPSSVQLEVSRAHAMRRLRAEIERTLVDILGHDMCSRLELKSKVTLRNGNGLFERWLLSRHLRASTEGVHTNDHFTEPLLPMPYLRESEVPEFLQELLNAGVTADKAAEAARALGGASRSAIAWFRRQRPGAAPRIVVRMKQTRPGAAAFSGSQRPDEDGGMIEFACGKTRLQLSSEHFAKLHELYQRSSRTAVRADDERFRARVLCLLLRYETLDGHGFQSAASDAVFDTLRAHLHVECECFASPLNCRFERFCSAFADVDAPFGSLGSFFDLFPDGLSGEAPVLEGSFEANPPFLPPLISAMASRMEAALRSAASARKSLSFVVIVPAKKSANRLLEASGFLQRTLLAENRRHVYLEGKQYAKAGRRLRSSTCDTAVFFLQTREAAARWPVTDALCSELLAAMTGDGARPYGISHPSDAAATALSPLGDRQQTEARSHSGPPEQKPRLPYRVAGLPTLKKSMRVHGTLRGPRRGVVKVSAGQAPVLAGGVRMRVRTRNAHAWLHRVDKFGFLPSSGLGLLVSVRAR